VELYRDFAAAAESFGCKSIIVLNPTGITEANFPAWLVRVFEKYSIRKSLSWTSGTARTATPMILSSLKSELTKPSMFTEEQFKAAYNKAVNWEKQLKIHKVFFFFISLS
jgi:hypothetical protein